MTPMERDDTEALAVRIGAGDDPPVTVTVVRRPPAGREAEFAAFLQGITESAARFPGHLGASVSRPEGGQGDYRVVFTFDHVSNLRRWDESAERRAWYARAKELATDEPELSVLTGLETWFTLSDGGAVKPPARYKMWLVSWLAVWPLISLINYVGR